MKVLFLSLLLALVQGGRICTNPKGNDGESYTEGCLKMTCKTGVWRSSLQTSLCCYDRQPYLPNTTITATEDGCASAITYCTQEDDVATAVLQVENTCGDHSTEEQVQELKHLLVKHMEQTDCDEDSPVSTSTTSTTTSPEHGTKAVGILIAGGGSAKTSTEIFLPGSGKSCALADLPDERWGHTLDTVGKTAVLCGGKYTETSCLQFSQDTGTWSSYATTLEIRDDHSSWVTTEETLVLMGGFQSLSSLITSGITTEIVNSGMSFTLVENTRYACSIQLGSYTIITGGTYARGTYTSTSVSKYNLQGHVEDLPSLLEGRNSHACGSFQAGGDTVLVVAGGWSRLRSTERHRLGVDSEWTAGKELPRRLSFMASVSMDQAVIILGGYDGDTNEYRSEILSYNGEEWTELGQLGVGRSSAAATKISVDPAVCG